MHNLFKSAVLTVGLIVSSGSVWAGGVPAFGPAEVNRLVEIIKQLQRDGLPETKTPEEISRIVEKAVRDRSQIDDAGAEGQGQ